MTYNVFGGTLNLIQSINHVDVIVIVVVVVVIVVSSLLLLLFLSAVDRPERNLMEKSQH